ncbi:hypothetical protein FZI91_20175 [Mycobacterium sp. CBMA271]|uniref:hypothetical protein n=1 Tax=unclassified Mycobacteroides TaxID=2618759 RepID=UPI0012DE4BFD|nr:MULTISPECIES: hypothetical protein [unclassified Mycobacteroides]MUM17006.1 hypothetical protein [Mycobacteroides sp. CBMA 326]MUM24005.1 hypothetical protein [Mycobacteroides sp. CBMA 271]
MLVRRWMAVLAAPVLVAGCSLFGSPQRDDWRAKTDMDSAELALRAALRTIDPCGFVDAKAVQTKIPRAISYGYTEGFDRCTLQLGAFAGDFPSDVSATIGFDLSPAPGQIVEQPIDSFDVNGIMIAHVLGPTSNRGWCRYVFNLGAGDLPGGAARGDAADLMRRVRVTVVASLSKDPGPGRPVYPCDEAIAIASGAARIRSERLPLRSGSAPSPIGQDPCSLLADLRGFASYRPGGGSMYVDLYSCYFSQGAPEDRKAGGILVELRPVSPDEPDRSEYGNERHAVTERRDGVELHVSTITSKYDKPSCEVFVFLGKEYLPTYFAPPEAARPEDVRVPGAMLRGMSCDEDKAVAVAAGQRFAG